jgi:E3 ubiquitin-protein ligase CCNP1IP1
MAVEQESIRRKNEELAQALREKTRKHLQTQELYDKLKRRAMLGHVQEAALDAVDHTIQESVAESRLTDRVGNDSQRPPPPLFSHQQNSHMPRSNSHVHSGHHPKAPMDIPTGGWAGFNGQGSVQRRSSFVLFPILCYLSFPSLQKAKPSRHHLHIVKDWEPGRV